MALNIKDLETERLAAEVATLAHETKTHAIRVALQERLEQLRGAQVPAQIRDKRIARFLENEAWPQVPDDVRGRAVPREEWDEILGYGPEGV